MLDKLMKSLLDNLSMVIIEISLYAS